MIFSRWLINDIIVDKETGTNTILYISAMAAGPNIPVNMGKEKKQNCSHHHANRGSVLIAWSEKGLCQFEACPCRC